MLLLWQGCLWKCASLYITMILLDPVFICIEHCTVANLFQEHFVPHLTTDDSTLRSIRQTRPSANVESWPAYHQKSACRYGYAADDYDGGRCIRAPPSASRQPTSVYFFRYNNILDQHIGDAVWDGVCSKWYTEYVGVFRIGKDFVEANKQQSQQASKQGRRVAVVARFY